MRTPANAATSNAGTSSPSASGLLRDRGSPAGTAVVVIEFCGQQLALTREQLEAAVYRARELFPPAMEAAPKLAVQLVDAKALAALTSLPASWLEEQARQGSVPSLQLGKYRRFHVDEAIAAIRQLGRSS